MKNHDKYEFFTHATDSFDFQVRANLSHADGVKNWHEFFTRVKNSTCEVFTCVTNTLEFFTHLKLDICEEFVPIKISKLFVRMHVCHTKVTRIFVRILHMHVTNTK